MAWQIHTIACSEEKACEIQADRNSVAIGFLYILQLSQIVQTFWTGRRKKRKNRRGSTLMNNKPGITLSQTLLKPPFKNHPYIKLKKNQSFNCFITIINIWLVYRKHCVRLFGRCKTN